MDPQDRKECEALNRGYEMADLEDKHGCFKLKASKTNKKNKKPTGTPRDNKSNIRATVLVRTAEIEFKQEALEGAN